MDNMADRPNRPNRPPPSASEIRAQVPQRRPIPSAEQRPEATPMLHYPGQSNGEIPMQSFDMNESYTHSGYNIHSNPHIYREDIRPQIQSSDYTVGNRDTIKPAVNEPVAHPTQYKPTKQHGYLYNAPPKSRMKWKHPMVYQERRRHIAGASGFHFDFIKRFWEGDPDDRYLSPWDGHLAKLVVQCTQDIYNANYENTSSQDPEAPAAVTWRRTFIRNSTPAMLRLACWEKYGTEGTYIPRFLRYILSFIALLVVKLIPVEVQGATRNLGHYDPVPYKYWGYPRQARNVYENKNRFSQSNPAGISGIASQTGQVVPRGMLGTLNRLNRPQYLCFLDSRKENKTEKVTDWIEEHGEDTRTDYVFISWTTAHFSPFHNPVDAAFLHSVGAHAAEKAGVPAYWLCSSCLGETMEEVELNVWQICDVVRSSHSMVVVIDQPVEKTRETLIAEWSERVWTLPELLLCPGSADISLYHRGISFNDCEVISRRNLRLTKDRDHETAAKALVDHYEGNVILSPLELTTVALSCFYNRGRPEFLDGDLSYALMGLLRQRPPVNRNDSAFQAFARLSLANDSNRLLERLICILPRGLHQPWHSMDDQWEAVLWDIYPTTQVCGIGEDNTIIIDNARAAAVRWKSFAKVGFFHHETWKRLFARLSLRASPYLFWLGVILLGAGSPARSSPSIGVGVVLIIMALFPLVPSPYLIRKIYGGKIWGAQPWFFGFEGYMDIKTIERMIFGLPRNALSWSPSGSPLSWHLEDKYGRCVGQDPTDIPETKERVRRAITSKMGEEKIFTLVDTFTMTVTLFSATRPPTAVIMCGEEGGQQRALMCSYEWQTQTFRRETVLRMETPVYHRMAPARRLRLGLNAGFNLGNRSNSYFPVNNDQQY